MEDMTRQKGIESAYFEFFPENVFENDDWDKKLHIFRNTSQQKATKYRTI